MARNHHGVLIFAGGWIACPAEGQNTGFDAGKTTSQAKRVILVRRLNRFVWREKAQARALERLHNKVGEHPNPQGTAIPEDHDS